MINVPKRISNIFRRPFVKYGMPFFILIIGGSLGLREFSQIRFQYSKANLIRPEEAEALGIKMKKPGEVTMETEYEKIKDLDTENWEMVRGPRPWEETPSKK